MSKSHLATLFETVDVVGEGETQEKAVEEAFKQMRKKVAEEVEVPIVSMHTEDFIIHESKKTSRKESFLFVFMKRERISWKITATIKLKIDYIQLEEGGAENG